MTSTFENPTTRGRRRRARVGRRRGRSDRGAALVEFALISVPLFMILFGTIEFGWAFFQLNDIRHGAREGIRLVVVDSDIVPDYAGADMDTNGERFAQATCERMDRRDGVTVEITATDVDGDGEPETGDDVTLTTTKGLDQLTMVFDTVLSSVTLDEVITSRVEQNLPADVDGTTWVCK